MRGFWSNIDHWRKTRKFRYCLLVEAGGNNFHLREKKDVGIFSKIHFWNLHGVSFRAFECLASFEPSNPFQRTVYEATNFIVMVESCSLLIYTIIYYNNCTELSSWLNCKICLYTVSRSLPNTSNDSCSDPVLGCALFCKCLSLFILESFPSLLTCHARSLSFLSVPARLRRQAA